MIPRVPNEKELQFSHGWLHRFKKRFNIRDYTCHGEDASADTSPEALQRMEEIKTIVCECNIALTANADGSMILPPLVINQYLKPQAFSSRHILTPQNLGIMWLLIRRHG
jgi:hypothetical protein